MVNNPGSEAAMAALAELRFPVPALTEAPRVLYA
jgi:hypothetical protein